MNVHSYIGGKSAEIDGLVKRAFGEEFSAAINRDAYNTNISITRKVPEIVTPAQTTLLPPPKPPMRNVWFAQLNFSELPACCGACFVHQVHIDQTQQGKGNGKKMIQLIHDIARLGGFSSVSCIVPSPKDPKSIYGSPGHERMRHILSKAGWQELSVTDNARSSSRLHLFHLKVFGK